MDKETKEKPKEGAEGQERPEKGEKQEERPKQEKKAIHIVRVAETDLDGSKTVAIGIRKIKGIGFMLANAISQICPLADKNVGDLSDSEIKELEDLILNIEKANIPKWLLNRRRDPVTGEDKHLAVSSLQLRKNMDINKMKKLKTYKGVRHSLGLPVRGQRTRGAFRKGKAVGVKRVKQPPGGGAKKKEAK